MALTARIRLANGVSIIDLNGKINLGEGTTVLHEQFKSLLAAGRKNIVVNLADVTYMDSAGLGELVRCYTIANKQGGGLKLLHVQSKLRNLLRITKLENLLSIFENEQDAVASFSPAA